MEFVGNEGEVEQLRFKTVILRLYADNQSLAGKAVPHVKKSSRQSQTMEEPIFPLQRQRHQPNQETGPKVFSDGLNSLVWKNQTSAARGQCGSPSTFFMFVFFFPTHER